MKKRVSKLTGWEIAALIGTIVAGVAALICSLRLDAAAATTSQGGAARTFSASCAGCHGQDGSGATGMNRTVAIPDLRSPVVQQHSDARLAAVIAKGTSQMPRFESSLSDPQIHELVLYVRELAHGK